MTMRRLPFLATLSLLLVAGIGSAHAAGYDTSGAPEELPYRSGDPIPLGYHVERSARGDYVAAGAVFLGLGYGSAVAVGASDGFQNRKQYLLMPVFGPLFTINARDHTHDSDGKSAWVFFETVVDVLAQAGGAGTILLEEVRPTARLVRDATLRFTVSPQVATGFVGLSVMGQL
jgi:hypothetical protein